MRPHMRPAAVAAKEGPAPPKDAGPASYFFDEDFLAAGFFAAAAFFAGAAFFFAIGSSFFSDRGKGRVLHLNARARQNPRLVHQTSRSRLKLRAATG